MLLHRNNKTLTGILLIAEGIFFCGSLFPLQIPQLIQPQQMQIQPFERKVKTQLCHSEKDRHVPINFLQKQFLHLF